MYKIPSNSETRLAWELLAVADALRHVSGQVNNLAANQHPERSTVDHLAEPVAAALLKIACRLTGGFADDAN